ncbi:helix-turn-helix domain-containing protein [Oscillatoria laete-virens NRMC-F 0139]|nr:helix-turn-helix domain-containing protein [Oscillatoria laete-virens]MDL5055744.1 helix-turn-helix domain-containing protein [Oscillatoria laete-virens NRMC-F 0139]
MRFNIGTGVLEYSAFDMHHHEFAELVIILGGSAVHITPKEEYVLEAGDVFVINPKVMHGFREIRRLKLCNIMYDPTFFIPAQTLPKLAGYHALFVIGPRHHASGKFENRLRLSARQLAEALPLTSRIEKEFKEKQPGYQSAVQGLFILLVTALARAYSRETLSSQRLTDRLARVISFLEDNYHEKIPLPQMASMAGLSVNQFLRLFRRDYQTSPTDYLIRLRIAKACELIRTTDRSITQIAFDVGFSDSNYFYRQFSKIMGINASKYRRKMLSR